MQDITPKQRIFADEYILTGNATQSYKKAYKCGIKNAESSSSDILRNPKVKQYIESVNKSIQSAKIADMREIKEFWTEIKRDAKQETKDRLKASEFIARTNAAFIDKSESSVEFKLPNIIIK